MLSPTHPLAVSLGSAPEDEEFVMVPAARGSATAELSLPTMPTAEIVITAKHSEALHPTCYLEPRPGNRRHRARDVPPLPAGRRGAGAAAGVCLRSAEVQEGECPAFEQ